MFYFHKWVAVIYRGNSGNWHCIRTNQHEFELNFQWQPTLGFIHPCLGKTGQHRNIHSYKWWHGQAAPYFILGKRIHPHSHISPKHFVWGVYKSPVWKSIIPWIQSSYRWRAKKCLYQEWFKFHREKKK